LFKKGEKPKLSMEREIRVEFADDKLKEAYHSLKDGRVAEHELYESLGRAFDEIKKDVGCGKRIRKELWPKEYIRKYGITNLWKYDLPHEWRMMYTIGVDEISVIAIMLEWMDHKKYERRFGYK